MMISKIDKVVIFEETYKKIYQRISNLKNSIDWLLKEGSDLNYKTN